MAIQRDNLHYSFRPIDGYNKAINIVISPREPGKTTSMWMDKIYLPWKKNHKPWIYLVRQAVEIDDALIESIFSTNMNKFTDDGLKPIYKPSTFSNGIVDIFLEVNKEKILFVRIVSLNIKMYRIKKAILRNIAGVFMDEFIINPQFAEKYLPKEFERLQEAYSTWRREADGVLKMYFCGNPYSLFNPLFVGLKVDISKLKRDSFYVGDSFVIHWAILTPELKAKILEENPFYKFDEEYSNYAVDGQAVNDSNIKLGTLPRNFYLSFVIKINRKYVGIFQNNYIDDMEDKFFCKFLDEVSARRTIYCFEFEEMLERSILVSMDERYKLQRFKEAMRKRLVSFEDINVYYYCEEVYKNL
ncbi:MAG: phage DNA encapsidation protein [Methanobrevibacter sp.]|nr:phage DNA encapsidation protein [Methanobrevibacter sp.]